MLNLIKSNANQYTFTDGRFYECPTGEWIPSVTTILEAFPKPYQLLQWMKEQGDNADKVRDAAGKRGSQVHQLTEDYDNGEECSLVDANGNPKYSLETWGMFERYVDFSTRFNPENELIEINITDDNLGYAGTIDRIAVIDGKRYVVDIKTSNMIADTYWLQLAAYKELILSSISDYEDAIDGVAILWLNAKTRTDGKKGDIQGKGWQLIIKEDTASDWELFQNVFSVWKHVNKDAKPKLLTYQITHKK
jgi:hypothetical protein